LEADASDIDRRGLLTVVIAETASRQLFHCRSMAARIVVK
jgi:hypothetical protein